MRVSMLQTHVVSGIVALTVFVSTIFAQPALGAIRVDSASQVNGPGDLLDWSNAFVTLDAALVWAADPEHEVDEIWVAAVPGPPNPLPPDWWYGNFGTYIPTVQTDPNDARSATFLVGLDLDGVKIYGGFLGLSHPVAPETSVTQRNPMVNRTILAGDLLNGPDRKYHVVTFDDVGGSTRLDGFWLVHGAATTDGLDRDRGGGMLIRNANPLIARCYFFHNYATAAGAGIYLDSTPAGGTLHILNCTFNDMNGSGESRDGAAVYNNGGSVNVMNCQFHGNHCTGDGAGVYNNGGSVTMTNCVFWANESGGGIGMDVYGAGGTTTAVNSIFWRLAGTSLLSEDAYVHVESGTLSVTYSCIADEAENDGDIPFGGAANHNIDRDPQFVNPYHPHAFDVDLRLQFASPCIGRGDCSAVPADLGDLDSDGDGNEPTPRDLGEIDRFRQRVDLGPHERALCDGDASFDGVVDIDDLLVIINGWGPCPASAPPCPGDVSPAGSACGDNSIDIDDLLLVINNWDCPNVNPEPPPQGVFDCLERYSSDLELLEGCIEAMVISGTP